MDIKKQLDELKKASLGLALQQLDESYNKIQEHHKQSDKSGAFLGKEWFVTLDGLITDHISKLTNFQTTIQRNME